MRLTRTSLVLLPAVCGGAAAFLNLDIHTNVRELSARSTRHDRLHRDGSAAGPPLVLHRAKSSTQVQYAHEWPDESTVKVLFADSDNFVRSRELHRAVAIVTCTAAFLLWFYSRCFPSSSMVDAGIFDDNVQLALLLLGYVVVGIPHGLLDLHLTPRVLPGREQPSFLAWVVPYVGVMGVTLAAWLAAPALMLGLFLLNTILHFGEGDVAVDGTTEQGPSPSSIAMTHTEIFARGSYFGAAVLHQEASLTADFQGVLGGGDHADAVAALLPLLRLIGVAHYAALLAVAAVHLARAVAAPAPGRAPPAAGAPHRGVLLEMAVLSLLHATVPARVSVFLYLLAFHAPRHVLRAVRFAPELGRPPADGPRRWPLYGLATVATMAVAYATLGCGLGWARDLGGYVLPAGEEGLRSPGAYLVLRTVVVGTSVLTTPHSVVIFLLGQKEKKLEKSMSANESRGSLNYKDW